METQEQRSVITGNEGAPIELNDAVSWTTNYRRRNPNAVISQFFGRTILSKILEQDGCLGIRIYFANEKHLSGWQSFFVGVGNFFIKVVANVHDEKRVVIVGVKDDGKDQLPHSTTSDAAPAGEKTFKLMAGGSASNVVADRSHPCPGSAGCPKGKLSGGGDD
ncbi:hypothetical protein [Mucilaginibacter sp. SP1R1]|uniref:hypothetical protein n=1 Tax=Mucilaginibacter sp. SP1R1 TaxID=2723091 RepID=UPI0016166184|nr:hypothetical protein [Mucilaginibacter sp. SP1R1]MBB6150460.1 hypothetical protein [Mucilaginibacter sp. SP1R1]